MNAALIDARDDENRAKLIAEGAAAVEEAQRVTVEQTMGEISNQRSRLRYPQVSTDDDHKELKVREKIRSGQGQEQTRESSASPLSSAAHPVIESPWIEHSEDTLKPKSWAPTTRRRGE